MLKEQLCVKKLTEPRNGIAANSKSVGIVF